MVVALKLILDFSNGYGGGFQVCGKIVLELTFGSQWWFPVGGGGFRCLMEAGGGFRSLKVSNGG